MMHLFHVLFFFVKTRCLNKTTDSSVGVWVCYTRNGYYSFEPLASGRDKEWAIEV